ncbi:Flp pilus assembly protein CpaB [Polynucleobacter arcticus]|uniref:Flp pilus assembly protein CpaB n=1 Tax=Polynucleobacter arcticus TaxID=1743165 RepID=A0A6M9PJG6_9BURK|nr:Flp pilus assembly protein CpaB [Polynucleobacter arcticus]QKM60092.1 Flp pilus assembly protein CpaB [Polynucleobacter arcticus]
MRDKKLLSVIIGSGVFSLLVAGIFYLYLANTSPPTGPVDVIRVYSANKEILPGSKIASADITAMSPLPNVIPAGAIFDINLIVNKVAENRIGPGEIIVSNMISQKNLVDVASDLPAGARAFTITVNEISGVGGFVVPGNYVDVILSGQDPAYGAYSKVIVQNARVLAISQLRTITEASKVGNSATLQISADEVNRLDLARTYGTLSLVLRSADDINSKSTIRASNQSGQFFIETIRGSVISPTSTESRR